MDELTAALLSLLWLELRTLEEEELTPMVADRLEEEGVGDGLSEPDDPPPPQAVSHRGRIESNSRRFIVIIRSR